MVTCLRRPGRQAQSVIHPDAAGIDLAAEVHYDAVPADRDPQPVRHFGTTTDQPIVLADWLQKCQIPTVAMESTGVHWIPRFELLEDRGLEVCLVSTLPVANRLATALRMAAQSLNRVDLSACGHAQAESLLGDWFRRMRAKLGPAGAVTAAAHKLARILYTMNQDANRLRSQQTRQSRAHPPTQKALPAQASGPTRLHPPTSQCGRCCLSEE
ncbi:MAG: hypothetical protein EXS37_02060 [Opitutus sp.]|nr:hypothetical protein [Opitutus sp.]